jgi:hypothetical protein
MYTCLFPNQYRDAKGNVKGSSVPSIYRDTRRWSEEMLDTFKKLMIEKEKLPPLQSDDEWKLFAYSLNRLSYGRGNYHAPAPERKVLLRVLNNNKIDLRIIPLIISFCGVN